MTIPEAIKFCEGYLPECDTKKFVIEQLGYREKKRPEGSHHCPTCGAGLAEPKVTHEWCSCCYYPNYCMECGQQILWEDDADD